MLLAEGLKQICTADKTAASIIEPKLEKIIDLLSRYMDEIERFNPLYGLVKTDTENPGREILTVKHILDSLAPLGILVRLLEKKDSACSDRTIADVGSGAGLPGIPLAICLPDVHFFLIERMTRRAGFLRNVTAVLGLTNIHVEETELEKAPPGRLDIVTLRALSPLKPILVKNLLKLLRPAAVSAGAFIAAYKGKHETAAAELAGLSELPCTTELIPITVPFLDEERCLARIVRIAD